MYKFVTINVTITISLRYNTKHVKINESFQIKTEDTNIFTTFHKRIQ